MKYISQKDSLPGAQHFAALVFSSIHIVGDERSRTNPGHGYPAEDRPIVNYIAFESREEMSAWVVKQESRQFGPACRYCLIESTPLSVKTTVQVSVSAATREEGRTNYRTPEQNDAVRRGTDL